MGFPLTNSYFQHIHYTKPHTEAINVKQSNKINPPKIKQPTHSKTKSKTHPRHQQLAKPLSPEIIALFNTKSINKHQAIEHAISE